MDAYREMTRSTRQGKMMLCLPGIEVYDGEDPSRFEGWLDAVKQACNMTDRNLRKEFDEEVNQSHQRNTLHDECLLD